MRFIETKLLGLYSVVLKPVIDTRGFFVRSFCMNEFSEIKKDLGIVQINHSMTKEKAAIRGMHYQLPPFGEIKIVRCIRGSVFDVAVDIRRNSKTFLKWHGEILSDDNMRALFIPEGFAHGFQTLEENCEMLYLHSQFYKKDYEAGLKFDDPEISIKWELPVMNVSERDRNHPLINDLFKGVEL